jgi:hypothetical protein
MTQGAPKGEADPNSGYFGFVSDPRGSSVRQRTILVSARLSFDRGLVMTMKFLSRVLTAVVVVVVVGCFSTAPASAAKGCKGTTKNGICYAPKKAKKFKKHKRVVVAHNRLGDRQWHGWGASFHLDGVSYAGGNRRGPAAWHNNYEGGFHPEVFWKLSQRNLP